MAACQDGIENNNDELMLIRGSKYPRQWWMGLLLLPWLASCVSSGDQGAAPGGIQLSYNICLDSTAAQLLPPENQDRLSYLKNNWIDTARQYYVKTLILNGKDTLHVSTFQQLPLRDARSMLRKDGQALLEREKGAHQQLAFFKYFSRSGARYHARFLLRGRAIDNLLLLDQAGIDSSRIQRHYREETVLKTLKRCL